MAAYNSPPQLLTRDECLQIIKNDLQYKDISEINLLTYKITKCSTDLVGFMGEYYKLEVEAEIHLKEKLQRSYFVKSLPQENVFYRDECERKGFFTKETAIYENILPNIQKYAQKLLFPKAYLTRKDILVLEDLSMPEKCLRQMLPNESYTMKHYQIFLEHLAELHAASLAWERKEKVNIGQKFESTLFEIQLNTNNEWFITSIKAILYLAQQHPRYQYPQALEFINEDLYNLLLRVDDFTKPSSHLLNVLCHRDSWDRNIFWKFDTSNKPIGCRIVDFQLTRYSPPAIDVLFFLYNNFETIEQRSKLMENLLLYYYVSLRHSLACLDISPDLISKEDFDKDCQRALFPVLTLRAICEPLMKLPDGWSQKMRESEPELFDHYMNADRTEMFNRVSKVDATYMDKVFFPVQELLEYFDLSPQ